ncbi:hydroxyisourate hydrolase [Acinetobacter qingfengensis]|uniref:5-hydroxyisourate hydrolase n=1 Tax=Acinetobacter qingfengensis TaxID=1262585 RepID=A0A1E7R990_9GAMM|nr:hydroxyisourate hydrolase [Acinetobacter qingfengensis]KAA8735470.1 hydroxyisourate hydrolase [Acinetobacter qingfengensis]OEY95886.1 hydroxyisourate hydrolase [Acinetobacter qingfengensis]
MSGITTHILDAALGRPAINVAVKLLQFQQNQYVLVDQKLTDVDGRIKDFKIPSLTVGDYQLVFEIASYFSVTQRDCFYPKVTIDFTVKDIAQHYHVPLLISPFSYSTYRGS